MDAQMKSWVWIAVWNCSCLLAIMIKESNSALANDDALKNDVMSYWETRLHGARLPTSVRAIVSPLSSHEATQLLVTISASGGHYLPRHAATFCKATHIKCGEVDAHQIEFNRKTKEHTQSFPFWYGANNDTQNFPFWYGYDNAHQTKANEETKKTQNYPFWYGANDHTQKIPLILYDNTHQTKVGEETQNYPFWYGYDNAHQTKANEETKKTQNYPFWYGANDHTPNYPFWYGYDNAHQTKANEETEETQNYPFWYGAHQTEVSEGNKKLKQEASQTKPTLKTYEIEDSKALRRLTSSGDHATFGYFREKQVLVSGVKIRVNSGGYNGDAENAKADRAFLPRKLAKLFPLRGDGAKIASMLGVSQEDLQETLYFCSKLSSHDTNAEVRRCLTSLEDVADFVASILGASPNGIDAYAAITNASGARAELEKAGSSTTFRVLDVKELTADRDEPSVVCHDMAFPFRVFFCHYIKQTKIFLVTLQGEDYKSNHDHVAVCHYDTSYWSPQHKAFKDTQTKPGESEVCHWLGSWTWFGHTAWVFLHGDGATAS